MARPDHDKGWSEVSRREGLDETKKPAQLSVDSPKVLIGMGPGTDRRAK